MKPKKHTYTTTKTITTPQEEIERKNPMKTSSYCVRISLKQTEKKIISNLLEEPPFGIGEATEWFCSTGVMFFLANITLAGVKRKVWCPHICRCSKKAALSFSCIERAHWCKFIHYMEANSYYVFKINSTHYFVSLGFFLMDKLCHYPCVSMGYMREWKKPSAWLLSS